MTKNAGICSPRRLRLFFGRARVKIKGAMASKSYMKHSIWIWIILAAAEILAGWFAGHSSRSYSVPLDMTYIPAAAGAVLLGMNALMLIIPAAAARHISLFGCSLSPELIAGDVIFMSGTAMLIMTAAALSSSYRKAVLYEQKIGRDIELAKIAQRALLPKELSMGRARITGYIKQCMKVGGDFYYFRPFMKKYILITLGDVMGKGVTAAFVSAIIMGALYEWGKKTVSPSAIFSRLNQLLISLFDESRFFSTIIYGIYNEDKSEFVYAGAGHNGVLMSPDGKCSILDSCGLPVGMLPDTKWEDAKIKLESGSKIILFTDGITEAMDSKGGYYGIERVMSTAENHFGKCAEEIRNAILADVDSFTGGASDNDDRAIVIMEIS
ncbi:MAG: serine/threonine-protein phosphatase [bacterium]|nr:serine/threonine-protein phosphatase [bacterium]